MDGKGTLLWKSLWLRQGPLTGNPMDYECCCSPSMTALHFHSLRQFWMVVLVKLLLDRCFTTCIFRRLWRTSSSALKPLTTTMEFSLKMFATTTLPRIYGRLNSSLCYLQYVCLPLQDMNVLYSVPCCTVLVETEAADLFGITHHQVSPLFSVIRLRLFVFFKQPRNSFLTRILQRASSSIIRSLLSQGIMRIRYVLYLQLFVIPIQIGSLLTGLTTCYVLKFL